MLDLVESESDLGESLDDIDEVDDLDNGDDSDTGESRDYSPASSLRGSKTFGNSSFVHGMPNREKSFAQKCYIAALRRKHPRVIFCSGRILSAKLQTGRQSSQTARDVTPQV